MLGNQYMGVAAQQYAERLQQQGYPPSTIRSQLIAAGVPEQEADAVIHFRPAHNYTLYVALLSFILVLALGFAAYTVFVPNTAPAFSITLQSLSPALQPGGTLEFVKQVTSAQKSTVQFTYTIINEQTKANVLSQEESSIQSPNEKSLGHLQLPNNILPGQYLAQVEAQQGSKSAHAQIPFTVLAGKQALQSCTDHAQNQGETGIDCGGPCIACPERADIGECLGGCADFDSCTQDSCVNGRCVHQATIPCCGNFACENQETPANCPADCSLASITKSPEALVHDATLLAASSADRAAKICAAILIQAYADQCYAQVSKASKNPSICTYVQNLDTRDGCYLDYAQATNDYSMCDQLTNRLYKSSCYTMKNVKTA